MRIKLIIFLSLFFVVISLAGFFSVEGETTSINSNLSVQLIYEVKDGEKIVETKKVKELLYASIYDWEWAFIHRAKTNFPAGLAFSASYPTLEVGYSDTSIKFNEIWLGYNSDKKYVFGYRWDDRDNIRLADPPGPDYYIWINLKDIPVSLQDQISIITLRLLKDEKKK